MERKDVDDSMPNPGHPDVKRQLEAKIEQAKRSASEAKAANRGLPERDIADAFSKEEDDRQMEVVGEQERTEEERSEGKKAEGKGKRTRGDGGGASVPRISRRGDEPDRFGGRTVDSVAEPTATFRPGGVMFYPPNPPLPPPPQ